MQPNSLNIIRCLKNRAFKASLAVCDDFRCRYIQLTNSWPCANKKVLVVGAESSGTTVISKMLFSGASGRCLDEGVESWVWRAYMNIYTGEKQIEDYPRLQLFDYVKVPGFASILPAYRNAFPNSRILYIVRDPRDVLASTYRTFRVPNREGLKEVSWIKQDWLGLEAKDPVQRLACRWSMYLEASKEIADVQYLRYEDFVQNKVEVIQRLCSDFEIEFDEASALQLAERQASHRSARDYAPVGPNGWKDNPLISANDIESVQEICGKQMNTLGYSVH